VDVGDGGDAHVKIRGEGVEDLVGAHVGVGVDDTLAAALHDVGCEVDGGGATGECEGRLRTGALVQCWLQWTWGEILETRLRRAAERLCPLALPRAASARRLLGRGDASSSSGQLAID
jgi:hypothetical protein